MARITINDCDDEIAEKLRKTGISRTGQQHLKAADILDQAGILTDLIRVYDMLGHDQRDRAHLLDAINKAVDIGRILNGTVDRVDSVPEPAKAVEPAPSLPESKAPMFSS